MIKNCNDSILLEKGIDDKYILLYQIWKELTDKRTLSTYQSRVKNTINLIVELRNLLEEARTGVFDNKISINDCKKELQEIVKDDNVLKQHYRTVYNMILSELNKKSESRAQQYRLSKCLSNCYELIVPDYLEKIFLELEKAIEEGKNNYILILVKQIISVCISNGWSDFALFKMADLLLDTNEKPEQWEVLKRRLICSKDSIYEILIPLISREQTETIKEIVSVYDIEVMNKDELNCEYSNYNLKEFNSGYFRIKQSGFDYYSAVVKAIQKCGLVLDYLSYYNIIKAWTFRNKTYIAINKDGRTFQKIKDNNLHKTYNYFEKNNNIIQSARKILQAPNTGTDDSVKKKLMAAYSFVNSANRTSGEEEKFINYWIAFESLCRTEADETIIRNILEVVPDALCLRYIYGLVRNLIEDCKRCEVSLKIYEIDIFNEKSTAVKVRKMINILQNETYCAELLKNCKVNKLLLLRVEKARKLFIDRDALINRVETHHKHIMLQISRLYRIRNMIAHSASHYEDGLIRYVEHLEEYLQNFIVEILRCYDLKNNDDAGALFEFIKEEYACAVDIFNRYGKGKGIDSTEELIISNFEKTGIINCFRDREFYDSDI